MKKNIIKKNKIILSLIFPSYNEEKNLKLLLTAFKSLIKNHKIGKTNSIPKSYKFKKK